MWRAVPLQRFQEFTDGTAWPNLAGCEDPAVVHRYEPLCSAKHVVLTTHWRIMAPSDTIGVSQKKRSLALQQAGCLW